MTVSIEPKRWNRLLGSLRPDARHLRVRRFDGVRDFREKGADLTIAHITDQHVGRLTSDALQRAAVAAANDAKPDLVVLTGDYVAHDLNHLHLLEGYLNAIDAPTVAVLGNHDHWTGVDPVIETLERAGVLVLRNQWTTFSARGHHIQIAGVDDAATKNDDVEAATRGLSRKVPTLALSHVGDIADHLWDKGASLVLSGHTHAGQIAVGRVNELVVKRFAKHRFVHGMYGCLEGAEHPGALYVSAGIGSSRFSPRIGERAKPEVGIFRMTAKPGDPAD